MVPLVALGAIALPLLEIAVLTQLLVWAPWPLVLAVVVVGSLTGLVVLRQHGIADLRRWRLEARRNVVPAPEVIAAGLRDVAGILLAVPGVASTVAGVVLLAPPVRRLLAGPVSSSQERRRRRAVPDPNEPALLAAPVAAAPAYDPAGDWHGVTVAVSDHIAGAAAGREREATEAAFFGGDAPATEFYAVSAVESGPMPPRTPRFAPGTFVQPASAVTTRWVGAYPQTSDHGLVAGCGPAPPTPPLPANVPSVDGADDVAAEREWDAFAAARGWQDEPGRLRRRRRRERERSNR